MNWSELLVAALDEAHDGHGEDMCDCYERLRDSVTRDEYHFPPVRYDVPEPPREGPRTLHEHAMDQMMTRIEEDFWRAQKVLMEKFAGISSYALPRVP